MKPKVQIQSNNSILFSGKSTGLKVTQTPQGTLVYTPEVLHRHQVYQEHTMPHTRYSLTDDNSTSSVPGIHEFGQDIELLLSKIDSYPELV